MVLYEFQDPMSVHCHPPTLDFAAVRREIVVWKTWKLA
jgi:hypothetical protein